MGQWRLGLWQPDGGVDNLKANAAMHRVRIGPEGKDKQFVFDAMGMGKPVERCKQEKNMNLTGVV